jgi:hypothetical protein
MNFKERGRELMAWFEALSPNLAGGTDRNHENPQSRKTVSMLNFDSKLVYKTPLVLPAVLNEIACLNFHYAALRTENLM